MNISLSDYEDKNYENPTNIIIGNVVISKMKNGIKITEISVLEKNNIDISNIKKITLGRQSLDDILISEIDDFQISYDEIFSL